VNRAGDTEGRVVLTGFMGTGKTTVGRLLADRLGLALVDTDREIEAEHGPIPEIFGTLGEPGFRRLERKIAEQLADRHDVVVATGGGMMVDPDVAELLATPPARVFCLTASPDSILDRVAGDPSAPERPLLADPDRRRRVEQLLAERQGAYARYEHVATDGRSPEAVADEILRRLDRSSRTH